MFAKRQKMLPNPATAPLPQARARCRGTPALVLFLVLVNIGALLSSHSKGLAQSGSRLPKSLKAHSNDNIDDFQQCSINRFLASGLPFLDDVQPPDLKEFSTRRDRLADALIRDGLDAFVAEPGFTFQYYVNISQSDWEPWEPEERPFLMVITPVRDANGIISAKTSFLAPTFEAERVRLLGMPLDGPVSIVEWEEHWNPYKTLFASSIFHDLNSMSVPRVMVDDEMRDFIQRGLGENGFDVLGLSGNVEAVRETKSALEIEILRAVNTGTVEAIRSMRKCLYPGLTENNVVTALDETLRAGGLEPFFDLVLFDEDAANPHGGTLGNKSLTPETFVLIDVGAHLYGYSSDVTRTFFPPFLPRTGQIERKLREKMLVWNLVLQAQTASIDRFRPGNTAASVDIAARQVIADAGYASSFTHRLGHGIGIKAHEPPYLNQGNNETKLRTGMAFTSEPGVYLVNQFGVRHEDVFLVKGEGKAAECLSGQRARDPWNP